MVSVFFMFLSIHQESKTEILCKQDWQLKFLEISEVKMPLPDDETSKLIMNFKKDGELVVTSGLESKNAKWEFSKNQDSLKITNYQGEIKSLKLNELNETTLVMVTYEGGSEAAMHFKAKTKSE